MNPGTAHKVALMACTIEAAKNVTTEVGLLSIYESFEQRLFEHLAIVTSCETAGDNDAIQACFDREIRNARNTYGQFLVLVREVYFSSAC